MHSTEHERWYASLALGDRGVPVHAASELERCNVCATRAEDLGAVRGELERAAAEQAEVFDAAREIRHPPGAVEAERRLRALIASTRARPRARELVAFAALVAVLITALAFTLGRGPVQRTDQTVLGTNEFTALAPRDVWRSAQPLTWHYPLPELGWFVVRLRSRGSPAAFAESPPLATPLWNPPESERAAWPDEFDWQVSAYDASGRALHSSRRESLSRR